MDRKSIKKKNNITEVHYEHHVGGYRQQDTWKRKAGRCKQSKTMTMLQKTPQKYHSKYHSLTNAAKKHTPRAFSAIQPSIFYLSTLGS